MSVSPQVALVVRRDLAKLLRHHDALLRDLVALNTPTDAGQARALAFDAGLRHPGLAGLGELTSRSDEEREALLLVTTDTDDERCRARALVDATAKPTAFRALHAVYPASYRSPMLDAEQRYRMGLKALSQRRAWPESPVTLGDVYVAPACLMFESDERKEAFDDPIEALRACLSEDVSARVSLMGAAGSGKSVVCAMLAVALADDPQWLPVLLTESTKRTLYEELVVRFVGAGKPPAWFDAALLPKLVVFDDRSPSARRALPGASTAAVVRTTGEGVQDDDGFQARGILLRPFDEARVRRWASRWNDRVPVPFDVERLLAETDTRDALSYQPASSPFTLLMLAQMHAAGRALPGSATLRDRAALYREMVTWACERAASPPQYTTSSVRSTLREIAVLAHRAGESSPWDRRFERIDAAARVAHWPAKKRLPFPLVTDEGGASFFHESFAEYLLAEQVAFECSRLQALATDVANSKPLAGDREDLTRRWLRIFGRVRLDDALEMLLRVMIPAWEDFVRGGERTPSDFPNAWRAVTTTVYELLVGDGCWRLVVDTAESLGDSPSSVRARALDALLRFGGLTSTATEGTFAPYATAPDTLMDLLAWLRTRAAVLRARPYENSVTLANAQLSYADLAGTDLTGIELRGANLTSANLRGAVLRRCDLSGARLHGAMLAGAVLVNATLTNTVLIDANLDGCGLTPAQREAAVWTFEEGIARGIPREHLEDEIPF